MTNQVQLTTAQIDAAARAGIQLLADPELRVPLSIAEAGHYETLKVFLTALVNGEVLLTQGQTVKEKPNDGTSKTKTKKRQKKK